MTVLAVTLCAVAIAAAVWLVVVVVLGLMLSLFIICFLTQMLKLRRQSFLLFHDLQDLRSFDLIPRRSHYGSLRIMLAKGRYALVQLVLGQAVGVAQDY